MNALKHLILVATTATFLTTGAPSMAQSSPASGGQLSGELLQARQEGSIWTALALNRQLSPFKFEVTVRDGKATLKGAVEDEANRDLAEEIARATAGIQAVDNQLTLDPALAEQPLPRRSYAQSLEDLTLTAAIRSKLLWNTATQGQDIQVATDDGVVTLKGKAQTADGKQLAGDLAQNTDGVYQVNNLISLGVADTSTTRVEAQAKKVEDNLSDGWVTSKIKASLVLNRDLDGLSIEVQTKSGVVTLRGDVASSEQKTIATTVARNIRGVRGVDADLLKVSSKSSL